MKISRLLNWIKSTIETQVHNSQCSKSHHEHRHEELFKDVEHCEHLASNYRLVSIALNPPIYLYMFCRNIFGVYDAVPQTSTEVPCGQDILNGS